MSRIVSDDMTEAWLSQGKIGALRPVARATIQRQRVYRFEYDTAWSQGGGTLGHDRHRAGNFRTIIFGENAPYRELPNIKSCNWERSVGQDAATCTLVLVNTERTPLGEEGASDSDFDKLGFLTYNRGEQAEAVSLWNHEVNGWNGIIVPDMVIKTYEGYGVDNSVMPAQDEHLMQSGVWMVDKANYGADGSITVEMRDLARILIDTSVFPPAVPMSEYPLEWVKNHSENVPARDVTGGHWQDNLRTLGTASSSNDEYIGLGFTNEPWGPYVGSSGGVEGHHASHAIVPHSRDTPEDVERDNNTYWRSTGQDSIGAMVWWQIDFVERQPLAAVRISPHGGPFRVYVSVHNGSTWVGKKKIPYGVGDDPDVPGGVDVHANIPFVDSFIADRFFAQDYVLPRKYKAQKVRITFTHLRQLEVGEHPYRAGLREFQIYTGSFSNLNFEHGEVLKLIGNYGDYTHIIKWVCAWAGWYWPPHETDMDFIRVQSGGGDPPTKDYVSHIAPDPVLPKGRVWGDLMKTGTGGVAPLTVDMFDKKPMMDIINYVRDLIGFLFFIDETGGVVWRQPNLWSLGNYVSPEFFGDGRPGLRNRGRTDEIVELKDTETLLSYSTVLDSTNIRERIFVANAVGGVGTVIKGFNPYPMGLVRVGGYTDQHFDSKYETKVMADMISAQQMFSYKTSQVTIPGYPKIQVDDQVRIFERVTSDTFHHYVMGIKSSLDMESGEWIYDMAVHWLGNSPEDAWVVNVEELDFATQQYLAAVGYEPEGPEDDPTWDPA